MILALVLSVAAAAAPLAEPAQTATPFPTASVLDPEALATTTAREDVSQVALANQTAEVAHNSVTGNSVTGPVSIAGNAFQGSSGLTIVNANSGNNVAINAALNVNITFSPAP